MATVGSKHDGDVAQISDLLLPVSIVDPPPQSRAHLAAVCGMSFAGLCREDITVLKGDLVAGWQDGLVEENILYAQIQPVAGASLFGRRIWIAIEENLGANVPYALGQLAAGSEDGVEGLDMGIDGGGEGRVCRLVLGRVAEQLVSPQGIELE